MPVPSFMQRRIDLWDAEVARQQDLRSAVPESERSFLATLPNGATVECVAGSTTPMAAWLEGISATQGDGGLLPPDEAVVAVLDDGESRRLIGLGDALPAPAHAVVSAAEVATVDVC